MSTFECKVSKLKVKVHPNADALELAIVGDYVSCVRKGEFKTGQWCVYVPEGAVLPDWLITRLGLTGKLAGPEHNRVKAIKLRGILSQGLIVPLRADMDFDGEHYYTNGSDYLLQLEDNRECDVSLGEDVAWLLDIKKYEPPIPTHMAGEVFNAYGYTLNYDIENIKKFPNVLTNVQKDTDQLYLITEKLHGTWTCFGFHPDISHPIVTSKGLSAQGLAFKFNEANATNLYIRALANTADADGNDVLDRVQAVLVAGLPIYVLGETYGKGVQDLHYGLERPHFRVFDIYVGKPGEGRYVAGAEFMRICKDANIETVPVLWHGALEANTIEHLTNGDPNADCLTKGKVLGSELDESTLREGIVIRPLIEERTDPELGRVILKSVSEAYLLRKNNDATELN